MKEANIMSTSTSNLQKHSERSHALLSASGAGRWLNCTPSARLEDSCGERESSAYAAEGTLAHELSELYISRDILGNITEQEFDARLEEIMSSDLFNEEMLDVVPIYTEYCAAQLAEAKTTNQLATMYIEQKLDLTQFVPDSFGTADCIIVNDNIMEVIDLKYGKGVPVYADWNKQLMLYGLGALRKYDAMYDIQEVRLTIVQPRINNISSWQISTIELLEWAGKELVPKAKLAFEGKGELNAGAWCRFCVVRNRCRKLYEQQLEIAKHEFADPELLTDEEIAEIVKRTPKLIEWANSIAEYAQTKAVTENKMWPGLKLVEGISRRKWLDEDKASNVIFARCPELSEDEIFNMKLKPITSIEKIMGKKRFEEILSDMVIKPQGKPTLVPVEDKRPAMGHAQAQIDFSE